ncbi:flagellar hook assembly protein FlgD [Lysinibacillus sp. 54212]|uniref:flagellar hook assembly protein FlgD n=1 Tax=Lysinibacillus sp. 54212 TaxID=3119829 RepID=UPI002FCB0C47
MTKTSGIPDNSYLNTSNIMYTTNNDNGALGKDAFLKILITQLQNQDPTNPMDDREFISQMAQFSSLEQMQNMTKAMEALLMSQMETQLMSYTSFIGKEVKWHEVTDKKDDQGKPIIEEGTGVITEVKFKDGSPVFILDSGKEIAPGNISSILANGSTAGAENPFAQASKLIGEKIQYTEGDVTLQATIEAITNKNGIIEYILNNGSRLTREQFTLLSDLENEGNESDKEESETETV